MPSAITEAERSSRIRGAPPATFEVVVQARTSQSDTVTSLEFAAPDRDELPAWEPGAHITVHLPGSASRQFSLCGNPDNRRTYRIAVLFEPQGRGGSRYLHDQVQVGDLLQISGPSNLFRLEPAPSYQFIAGGIGITPIISMISAVNANAEWQLTYLGRSRNSMAFLDELTGYDSRVSVLAKDEVGPTDLRRLIGIPKPGTLVYACGPERLLAELESMASDWPGERLRVERFVGRNLPIPNADTASFEVECVLSQLVLTVPPDRSILETAEKAGLSPAFSCREGTCGTCEVRVLAGCVDHRDAVLSAAEQEANETMMICCSRARSPRLKIEI